MYRLYKTFINTDGSYFLSEPLYFNNEQDHQKLLNRSLKTCEELEGVSYLISYTTNALYYDECQQRKIVYNIANANRLNTLTECKETIKEFYPEYSKLLSDDNIIKELNHMSSLVLSGEKLYPNIKRIIQVRGK